MWQKIKEWWNATIVTIGVFFKWIGSQFKKLWAIITGKDKKPPTDSNEVQK